jgi:uncharacterized protein
VRTGHINLTHLLLESGADSNASCDGRPPLRDAARRGTRDLVLMLLNHGARVDGPAGLALLDAAEHRRAAAVKLLLDHGAEVTARNAIGQTALHMASGAGDEVSVRYLLERGAEVNVADDLGQTPLDLALNEGWSAVGQQLLEAGAEPDIFTAVALDDVPRLQKLLAADLSGVRLMRRGFTPLHEAARRGHLASVNALLAHQADADAVTTRAPHVTPLFLAVRHGHADVVDLLLKRGVDADSVYVDGETSAPILYFALLHDHESIFRQLLARGAEVDAMCDAGGVQATLLTFAVRHNRRYAVQALLDHRAAVNARANRQAPTPLFEAVRRGDVELVAMLLAHGADPAQQVANQTPLMAAEARRAREPQLYDPIIALLLERTAMR